MDPNDPNSGYPGNPGYYEPPPNTPAPSAGARVEFKQYGALTAYAPDDTSRFLKLAVLPGAGNGFSIKPTTSIPGPINLFLDASEVSYYKSDGATTTLQTLNSAFDSLSGSFESEVYRATTAETALGVEAQRLFDEVSSGQSAALGFEVLRASSAEAALQLDIDGKVFAEQNRAVNEEQLLGSAITAEETRALAAEAALDAEIVHQVENLTIEITNTVNAVDQEILRATAAEVAIQAELDTEKIVRQNADIGLAVELARVETKFDGEVASDRARLVLIEQWILSQQ